jgi:hypothetical protein
MVKNVRELDSKGRVHVKVKVYGALIAAMLMLTIPLASSSMRVRHVDPAGVVEEPIAPFSFIAFYGSILDALSGEKWVEALQNLSLTPLIFLPSNVRALASRFNTLIRSAADTLREARVRLDEAGSLLETGSILDAKAKLREARTRLDEADREVTMLEASSRELAKALRASPQPLLGKVQGLRRLLEGYEQTYRSLWERLQLLEASRKVRISIQVDRDVVELGSWVRVRGLVEGEGGNVLPSRRVAVYFEDSRKGFTYTGGDGWFEYGLQIPYLYQVKGKVYAVFTPTGGDERRYATSCSNVLFITLLWEEPTLKVKAPPRAYPGRGFTVEGSLQSAGRPLQGFQVNIHFLALNASTGTGPDGSFKVSLNVPGNVEEGLETLTVYSKPRGLIGPAVEISKVKVERTPVTLEVEASKYALAGFTASFKGTAWAGGEPLKGGIVSVQLGGERVEALTGLDGGFEARMRIPLTFFTYNYRFKASAQVDEPWMKAQPCEGPITVINPIVFSAPLLLGAVTVRALKRGRKGGEMSEEVEHLPGEGEALKLDEVEARADSAQGLRGIYWRALSLVVALTNIAPLRSHTLREYLRLVKERVKGLYRFFESITLLYEKLLYGRGVSKGEEGRAEKCLERMEGAEGVER